MKYYSEVTQKMYDTVEELEKSEKQVNEQNKQKEEKKKELDEAIEAVHIAQTKANKLLAEYCRKYGAYETKLNIMEAKEMDKELAKLIFNLLGF